MTAHTPGPWPIEYDNDGNGSYSEWFNIGPAQVYIHSDDIERASADAAIISAALEMREVLELALPLVEGFDDADSAYEEGDEPIVAPVLARMRDVIKASRKKVTRV